jgi:hypothetical protein
LGGIFARIAASILRALMRCGSLQARSVNRRGGGIEEVRTFRVITFTNRRAVDGESRLLMRPQCHCGLAPGWWKFDPRDCDSEHDRLPAYTDCTIEFHFFFSFDLSVAVAADAEIFSDNSAQVLRTSAVMSEQLSIWRKTRLASSR